MFICVQKLNLCLEIPGTGAARESLSRRDRLEWAEYLSSDPEAVLAESRLKGLELQHTLR